MNQMNKVVLVCSMMREKSVVPSCFKMNHQSKIVIKTGDGLYHVFRMMLG
jgi:hypothetical protein